MANVETRRDENNTFLRSGCTDKPTIMRTHYLSRGSATICLFYRDLGARWLTTTAGGGHRKRKTIERGIGGFLRGAPALNMDWRGLWRVALGTAACTVSASCSSASTENFPIKGPEGQRGPSDHQCRSHGTRRAALGCAVKHTDHSRQCRAFVAPRRPATAASRRKNRPHRQHDHPPAGRPTARARVTRSSFASHEKPGKASHGCPCNTACATKS